MRFCRLYILVFIFFLSFNISVIANEGEKESTYKEYNDERISLEKKKKKLVDQIELLSVKKPRINFFYLLGGAGYICYSDFMNDNHRCNNFLSGDYKNGFAFSLIGGWQARKYIAMEIGVDYLQAEYRSMNYKYTLLFQPYIKIDKSWSIMPKVGLGFAIVAIFSEVVKTEYPPQPVGFDFYGVLGVRANYKNFIFGVSYEHNFYGGINTFGILAEAGIKF